MSLKTQLTLVLTLGVLAVSCASVFIKFANHSYPEHSPLFSLVIALGRMAIASLVLLPVALSQYSKSPLTPKQWLLTVGAGVMLALHFITWISSLNFTSIASSTALATTVPIWVAGFAWLLWREAPTQNVMVGVGITLLGGLLVALGQETSHSAPAPLLGNGLAVLGAITAALYFMLGNMVQRSGIPTQVYLGLVYSISAVVLLPLPWLAGVGYGAPMAAYLWIALLGLIPQLLGHTSFNWAMKHMNPTYVSLLILLEPVGSSFLAMLLFKEFPNVWVISGGLLLLCGVVIASLKNPSQR